MSQEFSIKPIAHIRSDFSGKFGVPRQSGLVDSLKAKIVFTPEYRDKNALRGIEDYSHLWLIWQFSLARNDGWSPTVRPPRLGGNKRMGVFATRSPFRPNSLGLSSVRLERVELDSPKGPILYVSGADLVDKTPIFDIKPYLPFTDSHPDALGGFADDTYGYCIDVQDPNGLIDLLPQDKRASLVKVLKNDPRPSYQNDSNRIYGFDFAGYEIKFSADDKTLTVKDIIKK